VEESAGQHAISRKTPCPWSIRRLRQVSNFVQSSVFLRPTMPTEKVLLDQSTLGSRLVLAGTEHWTLMATRVLAITVGNGAN
jgi:hypothetical protein